MVTAFDDTLRELKLSSRHDPLVEAGGTDYHRVCGKGDARCCRDAGLCAESHPQRCRSLILCREPRWAVAGAH
jgi:hypothetical protein